MVCYHKLPMVIFGIIQNPLRIKGSEVPDFGVSLVLAQIFPYVVQDELWTFAKPY